MKDMLKGEIKERTDVLKEKTNEGNAEKNNGKGFKRSETLMNNRMMERKNIKTIREAVNTAKE